MASMTPARPNRGLRPSDRRKLAVPLRAERNCLLALAYILGNFLRNLATPERIKHWSLTSLKEKLIKIGAKVVSHRRYAAFQMAEVAPAGTRQPYWSEALDRITFDQKPRYGGDDPHRNRD